MIDRLRELLDQHECLYGVICRDLNFTDVELMAQAGYHAVWLDMEHCPLSAREAVQLGRLITHLGMVPLLRIPELLRTHVQVCLDGGIPVLVLPDVRSAAAAESFAAMGKYPPLGRRGASSTGAGTGFSLGSDVRRTLEQANAATHLMAMIESDEGLNALDGILSIDGIDMMCVGPNDWSFELGLFGDDAKAALAPKVDRVVEASVAAGKTVALGVSSRQQARHFQTLGARMFFVGTDVSIKRAALVKKIELFR